MSTKKPEEGIVTLCGVQGCCPTVDFTDPQKVVIRDDFGGKAELTQEQWTCLKDSFSPQEQN